MRNLTQILDEMAKTPELSEVEEPRSEAERNFKNKHEVDVKADAAGNGDDVFKGEGTKKKKRKADREEGEDELVYEESEEDLDERELTSAEEKKKEEIVKGMKDNEAELKKKYGDDWKSVMYATATKRAKETMNEAVEVSHDRYMRSHGKKASGRGGMWMFSSKARGDVDYDNEKEVFQPTNFASKSFTDAAKEAKEWAKKHGHKTIYVMESVDEEQLDESKWVVTVNGKDGYGVFDNEADAKKKAQEVRKELKRDKRNADVSVIKEEKMKDDPCWDTHEMAGHKKKDGKKVPNCVPKNEELDESIEDRAEITFLEREILASLVTSILAKLEYVSDKMEEGYELGPHYIDSLVNFRGTVNDMYYVVMQQEDLEENPETTVSPRIYEELEENAELDKYIDENLERKEILEFITQLSEKNQKKAKNMMDSEDGLEKLKKFMQKHG